MTRRRDRARSGRSGAPGQPTAADITYGTNNEFGFDYLRDNMKFRLEDCVQRGHHFAIVDEVDSILIDEARTPLIISGPSEESTDKYYKINRIIPKLMRGEVIEGKEPGEKWTTGDYTVDEKHRTVALTEEGVAQGRAAAQHRQPVRRRQHRDQPPRAAGAQGARAVPARQDYVVKDGEVIIVDEFTGRLMPGRRWSDGLHQAVEAKEGVKIERENQTLATITFQNYFRMYKKLAGMTGTAETEAAEFEKIYKLEVTVDPDQPAAAAASRIPDVVYRTEEEKFRNAAKEIKELQREGPAGAGGHHFGRKIGAAVRHPEEDGRQARSAERQESRARSGHRGAGRAQGRGHGLHQHGRPRHRHSAGRQPGVHDASERAAQGEQGSRTRMHTSTTEIYRSAGMGRAFRQIQGADRQGARRSGGARRPAHPGHRAARIAPHRQPAARPRRTPGRSRQRRASISRCRTT